MILVEPVKQDYLKTSSGLIIYSDVSENINGGIVLEVSDDIPEIKTGDKVLYNKFAGVDIFSAEHNKMLLILNKNEILLVNNNVIPCNRVLINLGMTYNELNNHIRQVKSKMKGMVVDMRWNPQNYVPRSGEVAIVPNELLYDDSRETLWIDTTLEIQKGDYVYCSYLPMLLALGTLGNPNVPKHQAKPEWIELNGKVHVFIKYEHLIFKYKKSSISVKGLQRDLDPLNGYLLIEPLREDLIKTSLELSQRFKNKVSERLGIVAYVGKPLKGYKGIKDNDKGDINVGDVVFFDWRSSKDLEYSLIQELDKNYYYMQRLVLIAKWTAEEYKKIDINFDFGGKPIIINK
jgi:co-chaperonin GroES (HSP10)